VGIDFLRVPADTFRVIARRATVGSCLGGQN
jgi:hypothetical protein